MSEKQVFVSWSKPASQKIAAAFCDVVEALPLSVRCWCSQRTADLPLGPYDHNRIIEAASESDVCVSILTPENSLSPWIFFEAGIFYGAKKNVYGLLSCGVTHQQLKQKNNPIEGYHSYLSDKESFLGLIKSINTACNGVDERRFLETAGDKYAELLELHTELSKNFQDKEMASDATLTGMISKAFKKKSD